MSDRSSEIGSQMFIQRKHYDVVKAMQHNKKNSIDGDDGVSSQKSVAHPLENVGLERLDESSIVDLPRNIEKIHDGYINKTKEEVKKKLGTLKYYWIVRQYAWKLRKNDSAVVYDSTFRKNLESATIQKFKRKLTRGAKKLIAFYTREEMKKAEEKFIDAYNHVENKKFRDKEKQAIKAIDEQMKRLGVPWDRDRDRYKNDFEISDIGVFHTDSYYYPKKHESNSRDNNE